MTDLVAGLPPLTYNYLSLYRDNLLEEEFKLFLNTGEHLHLTKFKYNPRPYLYLILNPATEDIYNKVHLGGNLKNKTVKDHNVTVHLVRLETCLNSKARLRKIDLIWDDTQGIYLELELEVIEIGLLFYGTAWFILDLNANSNAINLISRISLTK